MRDNMKIKICVNSTKTYSEKTLPIIIPSLINSGISTEDIFVFEGGHFDRKTILRNDYTLIQTDHNSLDFTGLIDIVEYEMESDYWFYIHDTCKVGPKFAELIYNIPKDFPDKIALRIHPSMNIASYKYSYLIEHKDRLMKLKNKDYSEKKLKKLKDWCVYCEDYMLYRLLDSKTYTYDEDQSDLYSLIEDENWYGGVNRIVEYYPQLDLYKSKANYHRKMKRIIEV